MSECTCEGCVALCKRRPGWFAPGEAEKAAEFLELSFEEFFRNYLTIDYWATTTGEDTYLLTPASDKDPAGEIISFNIFSPRKCIFLDEADRCKIHSVKPLECRETLACEKSDSLHEEVALMWKSQEGKQEEILALVEGKRQEPTAIDLLTGMMDMYGLDS